MKSKFLRDRGKVSKTEPSANTHSAVYVPDPTSSGKRVSGRRSGGAGRAVLRPGAGDGELPLAAPNCPNSLLFSQG